MTRVCNMAVIFGWNQPSIFSGERGERRGQKSTSRYPFRFGSFSFFAIIESATIPRDGKTAATVAIAKAVWEAKCQARLIHRGVLAENIIYTAIARYNVETVVEIKKWSLPRNTNGKSEKFLRVAINSVIRVTSRSDQLSLFTAVTALFFLFLSVTRI